MKTPKTSPIRMARQEAGLTQIELCVRASVSPATLRKAEQFGADAVSHETMVRLSMALNRSLGSLGGKNK